MAAAGRAWRGGGGAVAARNWARRRPRAWACAGGAAPRPTHNAAAVNAGAPKRGRPPQTAARQPRAAARALRGPRPPATHRVRRAARRPPGRPAQEGGDARPEHGGVRARGGARESDRGRRRRHVARSHSAARGASEQPPVARARRPRPARPGDRVGQPPCSPRAPRARRPPACTPRGAFGSGWDGMRGLLDAFRRAPPREGRARPGRARGRGGCLARAATPARGGRRRTQGVHMPLDASIMAPPPPPAPPASRRRLRPRKKLHTVASRTRTASSPTCTVRGIPF